MYNGWPGFCALKSGLVANSSSMHTTFALMGLKDDTFDILYSGWGVILNKEYYCIAQCGRSWQAFREGVFANSRQKRRFPRLTKITYIWACLLNQQNHCLLSECGRKEAL